MPVKRVGGGYRWGVKGKVYKGKAAAQRQGRAVYAAKRRRPKKPR